ncbi:MAG: DNA replication protein [Vezdaea aestivalis]|nr:MAG: DNA replication protein [Vezdaea aestivalis]
MLAIGFVGRPLRTSTALSKIPNLVSLTSNSSHHLGTQKLVNLDIPSALSSRVVNALKANPRTVDLRALAPHFYSLVIGFLDTAEEEEGDYEEQIVAVLSETFKKRAAEIADHAHNPRGALGEGAEFLRGLDEEERLLFRAAHDSAKAIRKWMGEMKRG